MSRSAAGSLLHVGVETALSAISALEQWASPSARVRHFWRRRRRLLRRRSVGTTSVEVQLSRVLRRAVRCFTSLWRPRRRRSVHSSIGRRLRRESGALRAAPPTPPAPGLVCALLPVHFERRRQRLLRRRSGLRLLVQSASARYPFGPLWACSRVRPRRTGSLFNTPSGRVACSFLEGELRFAPGCDAAVHRRDVRVAHRLQVHAREG